MTSISRVSSSTLFPINATPQFSIPSNVTVCPASGLKNSFQETEQHLIHSVEVDFTKLWTKSCKHLAQSEEQKHSLAPLIALININSTIFSKATVFPLGKDFMGNSLQNTNALLSYAPLINERLFQHILGTHFGKGTRLEGHSAPDMLNYILGVLEEKVKTLTNQSYCQSNQEAFCKSLGIQQSAFEAMAKQFKIAQEMGNTFESTFETFFTTFVNKLKTLQEKESFFFQGGWKRKGESGHSVIYEIIRESQSSQLFTFRIYNRGDGAQYHTLILQEGGKQYTLPLTEILHIPFEELTKPSILKALYELYQIPVDNRQWDADQLYQIILPALGGQLSGNTYTPEQFMELTEVGHCTYLSLTGLVSQHLRSPWLFQRWEFELQFVTLWGFYQQENNNTSFNEGTLRLMRKGSEQFARNARQAFSQGVISQEEFGLATQKVEEIQHFLTQAEHELFKRVSQLRSEFAIQPGSPTWEPTQAQLRKPLLIEKNLPVSMEQTWTYLPQELPRRLREFHGRFLKEISDSSAHKGTFLSVKEAIHALVRKIPLNKVELETLFSTLTPIQAEEVVYQLGEIGRDYLWCIMNIAHYEQDRQARVRPADYLSVLKLLTLADFLSSRFAASAPDLCVDLPHLYQWDMGHFLEGRSGDIHLFDAEWERELIHLKEYWDNRKNQDSINPFENLGDNRFLSFFGFERLPASSFQNRREVNAKRYVKGDPGSSVSFGWDWGIEWKDLKWAVKTWLTRDFVWKKILVFDQELANQSPTIQMMFFLYDIDASSTPWMASLIERHKTKPDIFPRTFFALRDLSFTADFLLKNNWDAEEKLYPADRHKPFFATARYNSNNDGWSCGTLCPFSLKSFTEFSDREQKTYIKADPFYLKPIEIPNSPQNFDGNFFLRQSQDLLPKFLKPFYHELKSFAEPLGSFGELLESDNHTTFRRRIEPHAQLFLRPKDIHEDNLLGLEESRELLSLSGLPSRQVAETLAFFKHQPALLQDPHYQLLFKKLMFEPPLLVNKLMEDPKNAERFIQEIAEFCQQGFTTYRTQNDIYGSTFFLEISDLFIRTLKTTSKSKKQAISSAIQLFPDVKKELKSLLALPDLNFNQKTKICLDLLYVHGGLTKLSPSEVNEFLTCSILIQRTAQDLKKTDDEWFSRAKYLAIRDLPYRFQENIQKTLSGKDGKLVLDAIVSSFLPKKAKEWTQEGATYVTTDGLVRIDPLHAKLIDLTDSLSINSPLPPKIINQAYETIRTKTGREIQPGCFECKNSQGELYRVADIGEENPLIQRKIGELWHQKLQSLPSSLPQALSSYDAWMEDRSLSITESAKSLFVYIHKKIWFSDKQTGRLVYEVEFSEKNLKETPSRQVVTLSPLNIYSLNHKGERKNFLLANTLKNDGFLNALKAFEDGTYILAWIDPNTLMPQEIQLPRFGLKFTIQDEKAECTSFKGYTLAKNQVIPSLGDLSHYLVLEKDDHKLILFPREPLQGFESTLITQSIPNRPHENKPIRYFTYDLTKEGKIRPRTEEGRFYLALMRLAEQDYEEAHRELLGLGSQIREYTKEESEILSEIIHFGEANSDADPRSIAIRLKAGFWLLKNKEDFGRGIKHLSKDEEKFFSGLSELAKRALQKREQIPERFRLSLKEELFFFDRLERLFPFDFSSPLKAWKDQLNGILLTVPSSHLAQEIEALTPQIYELINPLAYMSFYEKWLGSGTNNTSILSAKELSSGFLETYRLIESIHQGDESKYQELYTKVIGLKPPTSASSDAIRKEILLVLEMILLGKSDSSERATAGIMLAFLRHPAMTMPLNQFPSAKDLEEMIKNRQLASLQNFFCIPLARFLVNYPPQQLLRSYGKSTTFDGSPINSLEQFPPEMPSSDSDMLFHFPERHELPIIGPLSVVKVINPTAKEQKEGMRNNRVRAKELEHVFALKTSDRLSKGLVLPEMDSLKERIQVFAANAAVRPTYMVTAKAAGVRKDLIEAIKVYQQDKKKMADALLELARKGMSCEGNHCLSPIHSAELKRISSLASTDIHPIELNEILYLFVNRDVEGLKRRNPTLSDPEIESIYHQVEDYLLKATSLQHLERLHSHLEKIQPLAIAQAELEKRQQLKEDLKLHASDIEIIEKTANSFFGNCNVQKKRIEALYRHHDLPAPDFSGTFNVDLDHEIAAWEQRIAALNQELEPHIEALANAERTKMRAYSIEKYPEYLVFEYFTDFLLRIDQIDNIEKIEPLKGNLAVKGAALEAIMGSGKTSVLLPLLALRNAGKGRLPLMVMPETLVNSVGETLRSHLKGGANQLIEVFTFNRSRRLDLSDLQHVEERLSTALEQKKAVLMSGASLQTFFLSFLERFLEFTDANDNSLEEEVQVFQRIFSLLREVGDLTLDEMDSLLDVLKAHHFTWGPAFPLPLDMSETIADLYQLLATDPYLSQEIKWNFLNDSGKTPFTDVNYKNLKPVIIQKILEGKVRRPVLEPFMKAVTPTQKRWIQEYLLGGSDGLNGGKTGYSLYGLFQWVVKNLGWDDSQQALNYIKSAPSPVKNSLAILKEELNKILPLTAKKQIDEHYGSIPFEAISTENSKYMSIPYHGSNNPQIGSEFGTDLEIINYTIQTHLVQGISDEVIQKKLDELKTQYLEAKDKEPIVRKFFKLGGNKTMNLLHLSSSDREQIRNHINASPKLQFYFIKNYILTSLKTYHQQLKTNAHLYPLLINKIKGFSGTLWNFRSYPRAFSEPLFSDTEAKTLLKLWEKSPHPIAVLDSSPQTVGIRKTLQKLYEKFDGSLIDLGGVFRGLSNSQVAKELLTLVHANHPHILGVAFYDEKGEIKVHVVGKKGIFTLEECGLAKDQLIAFWDQQHTTGADIALHGKMRAYVTVGRHLIMRDLLQGPWRLRGLDKSQQALFVVQLEEREAILETLQTDLGLPRINSSTPLDLSELMLFAKYAEAQRQSDDNFRSLHQKLEAALIKPLVDILINPKHRPRDISRLTPLVKELFIMEKPQDLFELYGMPEEIQDIDKAIHIEKEKILTSKTMESFRKDPFFQGKVDVRSIETVIDEIIREEKPYLPKQVQKKGLEETQVRVESLLNVNTETEIKTEYPSEIPAVPFPYVLWPFRKPFPYNYFQPTHYLSWRLKSFFGLSNLSKPILPSEQELLALEGSSPTVSVDNALAYYPTLEAAGVFDSNLLASVNFMPVYSSRQTPYQPFDDKQASTRNALLVRDRQSGNLQYILLDSWDAMIWESFFKNDQQAPSLVLQNHQICLYHRDLGITAEGTEAFPENVLKEPNSPFHALNAQAKFLNGEVSSYSTEELTYLEQWIRDKGAHKMHALFYEKILEWKDKSKKRFPKSPLGQIFLKLGIEIS